MNAPFLLLLLLVVVFVCVCVLNVYVDRPITRLRRHHNADVYYINTPLLFIFYFFIFFYFKNHSRAAVPFKRMTDRIPAVM